ncbi:MAG: RNA polymerase factor sigma-54 [Deltaproteobacteria bacterium]
MELKQKLELRHIIAPQLQQSLKILALPFLDLRQLVSEELLDNPVLEEVQEVPEAVQNLLDPLSPVNGPPLPRQSRQDEEKDNYAQTLLSRRPSLQDVLLRQLGMACTGDTDICIGQEIIGNIDDNGYLKASLEEISAASKASMEKIEQVLSVIQRFEPAGVGARTIEECLLIQLRNCHENDPLLPLIIETHLEDVARRNYSRIAKALEVTIGEIEAAVKKITSLDPKPGRNFSSEEALKVVPDIIIDVDEDDAVTLRINKEDFPRILISSHYKEMLRRTDLDEQTREFLMNKLKRAYELVRAVSRRQSTLRTVVEKIIEIQKEAVLAGPSLLKPLTFREIAEKVNLHESTICRVVMNKYCQTPCGVMALKDFFPSRLPAAEAAGGTVSSRYIQGLIKELIDREDKKRPLSDEAVASALKNDHNLAVARRTVTKYRESLRILSSSYRRIK